MTYRRENRLWTGQFVLVIVLNTIANLVLFVLLVAIPLFIRDIGGTIGDAGLSTGLYSLVALSCRPLIGRFLDGHGRVWIIRLGLVPIILGVILANFTDSIALQLVIRIIEGLGFSMVSTTAATMVSDLVPSQRIAEGIGYNGAAVVLMNSIGPFVGLTIISLWGFHCLFMALVPLSVLPCVISFFVKETGIQDSGKKSPFHWKDLLAIERGAVPASLLMTLASVSYGAVITFLPAFGNDRGIENMQFFFLLFPCAIILVRLFSGKMMDRYGLSPVVLPSLFFAFIAMILIYFSRGLVSFSLAAVIYGIGYSSLIPAFTVLAVQSSAPDRRGAANATFYIAMDLGVGGGSILLGYVADIAGSSSSFVISAVLMLAALILFPVLVGRKKISS